MPLLRTPLPCWNSDGIQELDIASSTLSSPVSAAVNVRSTSSCCAKKDRKTAILKLSITVPSYFNARIRPEALTLCRMSMGGMLSRSKCKEVLPAVFEVNEKQTAIEVFPDTPIPTGGTYAVVMNVFNPSQGGMFQFNALAQAPGDVPVSGYLGSWLVDID